MKNYTGNIIEDLKQFFPEERKLVFVHANEKTVFEIIESIKETFSFIDWTESIKRNLFTFDVDNIKLKFTINKYLEDGICKLVSGINYEALHTNWTENPIFESVYCWAIYNGDEWKPKTNFIGNEDEMRDSINFCVANNIDFTIGFDKEKHVTYWNVLTKNPFNYIFNKYGVTEESIDVAGQVANRKIKKRIEKFLQISKLEERWQNN